MAFVEYYKMEVTFCGLNDFFSEWVDPILLRKPTIIDSKLIFTIRIVFAIIITVHLCDCIASIIAIVNTQFLIAMTKTQRNYCHRTGFLAAFTRNITT